jgi:predicted nucleic acid-binding protein
VAFLVDACVLCEATRPEPNAKVLAWLDRHDPALHISTLTMAEILKGIHLLAVGRKRAALENWFEELMASFTGRIVPFDEDAGRVWGAFYARHERKGRLLSSFDSLLAATALAHGHTLATRNVTDFPDDVPVVNPWR